MVGFSDCSSTECEKMRANPPLSEVANAFVLSIIIEGGC